jgi:hypothetical protein
MKAANRELLHVVQLEEGTVTFETLDHSYNLLALYQSFAVNFDA